jgi:putative transposase
MPSPRYKPEQIVNLLRKVEVEIASGKTTLQAAREAGVTEQTYYRWWKNLDGHVLPRQSNREDAEPHEGSIVALAGTLV